MTRVSLEGVFSKDQSINLFGEKILQKVFSFVNWFGRRSGSLLSKDCFNRKFMRLKMNKKQNVEMMQNVFLQINWPLKFILSYYNFGCLTGRVRPCLLGSLSLSLSLCVFFVLLLFAWSITIQATQWRTVAKYDSYQMQIKRIASEFDTMCLETVSDRIPGRLILLNSKNFYYRSASMFQKRPSK